MHTDLDHLIRAARPEIPAGALSRAEAAVAGRPLAPLFSLRGLLRVAAVFALAVGAGLASAMLSSTPEAAHVDSTASGNASVKAGPDLAGLRADVAALLRGADGLAVGTPSLAQIDDRLAVLEAEASLSPQDQLAAAIVQVIENRDRRLRDEWRERHLAFVRDSYSKHLDTLVSDVRGGLVLSADQEKRFREILIEHGEKAESMIDSCYRRHHKRGRGFDELARETRAKLQAVLDEAQRNDFRVADAVLGADPMHWAPREEFEDATDVDTYVNWMQLSK
jgi:hypothetical protein